VDKHILNGLDIAAFSRVKPRGSVRDVQSKGFYWRANDIPGFWGEKIR